MALTILKITHTDSLSPFIDQGDKYQAVNSLCNYLHGLSGGTYKGTSLDLQIAEGSATAASGTVTFTGVGAALDTILINGVTFTARASGATGNEWNVGGSVTASATNLKNAINGSATALVNQHVVATSALGVVTITALNKGAGGNAITLAEGTDSTTAMAESGARLTGGANASANSFSFV